MGHQASADNGHPSMAFRRRMKELKQQHPCVTCWLETVLSRCWMIFPLPAVFIDAIARN